MFENISRSSTKSININKSKILDCDQVQKEMGAIIVVG